MSINISRTVNIGEISDSPRKICFNFAMDLFIQALRTVTIVSSVDAIQGRVVHTQYLFENAVEEGVETKK